MSLQSYLNASSYSDEFAKNCLAPLLSALFVHRTAQLSLPLLLVARTFALRLNSFRPITSYQTVVGGTQRYVERITARFRDRIRLNTPVVALERTGNVVRVRDRSGSEEEFDAGIVAVPADAALAMLTAPTEEEARLLGAVRYEPATVMLHRDARFMPRDRALWATFVYCGVDEMGRKLERPYNTYCMRELQDWLKEDLFVTIDPPREMRPPESMLTLHWRHLIYDVEQEGRVPAFAHLQGQRRTWFCGDYTRQPGHEGAFASGLETAALIA